MGGVWGIHKHILQIIVRLAEAPHPALPTLPPVGCHDNYVLKNLVSDVVVDL